MKKAALFLFLLFISQGVSASANIQQAADDVCNCMNEPNKKAMEVLQMVQKAQATGDMSQVMAAQGEMMGVISASSRCFEALPAKYPEINRNKELQDRVMQLADKQCPNPAAQMFRQR